MEDFFNTMLSFFTGLFGILLGLAYFLPLVILVVAIAVSRYLRERRGRKTVFSGEEPGQEGKQGD